MDEIEKYFSERPFSGKRLNKREKVFLKQLKMSEQYDKIYEYLGSSIYKKYTPIVVQAEDIYDLINRNEYDVLYKKYGERIYGLLLPVIKRCALETKEPRYLHVKGKVTTNLKAAIATALIVLASLNAVADAFVASIFGFSYNTGLEEYSGDEELKSVLKGYDASIKEYADYINSLHLSDLEVIVKVMDDMWQNIDGYSTTVEGYSNEFAYNRLALYHLGYGCCRHMADDFTARMNAINPKYEAYNLVVNLGDIIWNDTVRTVLDEEEDSTITGEEDFGIITLLKDRIGNHMVTCLKLPGIDLPVIVDPTNPSISIIKNGKIVQLNENDSCGMEICNAPNIGINWHDKEELANYLKDVLRSYFASCDFDELVDLYGTNSQNDVLDYLQDSYDSGTYGTGVEEGIDSSESEVQVEDAVKTMTLKPKNMKG